MTGYNITIQKSIVFIYVGNEHVRGARAIILKVEHLLCRWLTQAPHMMSKDPPGLIAEHLARVSPEHQWVQSLSTVLFTKVVKKKACNFFGRTNEIQ